MIDGGWHDESGREMAACFVLMQQVEEIERYRDEYIRAFRPILRKHGAEVLVTGFTFVAAEGDPPNSTVAAQAFLDDPEYTSVTDLRFSIASRGQAVIAPEFTPNP
jgi:uncharacterized protein (DUF1330 family)